MESRFGRSPFGLNNPASRLQGQTKSTSSQDSKNASHASASVHPQLGRIGRERVASHVGSSGGSHPYRSSHRFYKDPQSLTPTQAFDHDSLSPRQSEMRPAPKAQFQATLQSHATPMTEPRRKAALSLIPVPATMIPKALAPTSNEPNPAQSLNDRKSEAQQFLTTAKRLFQEHRLDEVEALLDHACDRHPTDIRLHAQLIRVLGMKKDFDSMERHLRGLFDTKADLDASCFNPAIFALANAHLFGRAIGLFDLMISKQIEPNSSSYNGLTFALRKNSQYDRAWDVFQQICASNLNCPRFSLEHLLSAFGKAKQEARAHQVYVCMRSLQLQPNLLSYERLVATYESKKKPEWCWEVYEAMRSSGVRRSVATFERVMVAMMQSGDWDHCWIAFEDMRQCHPQGVTQPFSEIVDGFLKDKDMQHDWNVYSAWRKRMLASSGRNDSGL